jgi:TetR/AcrR family acrAB operon transcriptional repressor
MERMIMPKKNPRSAREQERRRANREAILHAAETVIGRRGLSAASMDEVAAEAGFSKPTLYRYVRNKAELVFELIVHYLEDVDAQLKAIIARPLDPREKLLETLRFLFRFQSEKENLTRFFIMDRSFMRLMHVFVAGPGRRGPEEERKFLLRIKASRREIMADGAALFREGIAAGVFRPMDVDRAVLFFGALVQGYAHERFWDEGKPNLEKDVYDIYGFLLQGFERRESPKGAKS